MNVKLRPTLRLFICGGAVVVLVVAGGGCGGSSGGGSPTEPPAVLQVAGTWTGTSTLESAAGCGCVGEAFEILAGLPFPQVMQIVQNGSSIQGQLGTDENACEFSGTVGSQSLSATYESCGAGTNIEGFECLNGNRRDLVFTGGRLEATVTGNDMNGSQVETVDCFHPTSGEKLGAMRVEGRLSLRRG